MTEKLGTLEVKTTNPDEQIIEAVVSKQYSGKTDAEIAEDLGISLSTYYRRKREPQVKKAIVNQSKDDALLLLPTAVEEARKMLSDPKTPATSKTKLIGLVFTTSGLTKAEMTGTTAKDYFADDNDSSLDDLMRQYGIKPASDSQSTE